ncbi:uncharacterized protein N7515_001210 [Penicillium bovifimosum]|uniref:Uncharacterized protein n=1 Tax=Penicillium bovifimosum TaxID=126998 RepID=A0A9W9HG56_9EURO|nr:uncharacterized protein N7515_001210 [Penicillium bovifimosum]KAJ5146646.1 hypothetical protein N7515_001210 [Penicillium bovifimosum]
MSETPGFALRLEQESVLIDHPDMQLVLVETPPPFHHVHQPQTAGSTSPTPTTPPAQPATHPQGPSITNPTVATRQRRAYNRRIPSKQAVGYEESEVVARQCYDRLLKWHVLCNFSLKNINPVILNGYPDAAAPPPAPYTRKR